MGGEWNSTGIGNGRGIGTGSTFFRGLIVENGRFSQLCQIIQKLLTLSVERSSKLLLNTKEKTRGLILEDV
jgi:hypothetical protein